ncbi:TA system VapC family ribonuclease toxin [uncultured Jatrophihabitans sp.]|uniref:TA system VapC family ribonuclease toxin n=1 Tax=uncultured Jatrophihabitans sp. TaxID=1610747 RepID=UPI0035CB9F28
MLLDSSTLIAIAITEHEHHAAALGWLGDTLFATCPITQGALVRAVVRSPRGTAESALELVREISALDEHEFWSDELTFADVSLDGVIGHRQVTDAYLAQLARHKDGRIATLDRAMAAVHSDVAELVPT